MIIGITEVEIAGLVKAVGSVWDWMTPDEDRRFEGWNRESPEDQQTRRIFWELVREATNECALCEDAVPLADWNPR